MTLNEDRYRSIARTNVGIDNKSLKWLHRLNIFALRPVYLVLSFPRLVPTREIQHFHQHERFRIYYTIGKVNDRAEAAVRPKAALRLLGKRPRSNHGSQQAAMIQLEVIIE